MVEFKPTYEFGKVPNLTIIFMYIALFIAVVLPIALLIYYKKKYKARLSNFIWGIVCYLLFAIVLESAFHAIVLITPAGPVIDKNPYLYAFQGAIGAALFEELARFVAFKFLILKDVKNKGNAFMYGVGHGGLQLVYIVVAAALSTIALAATINDGTIGDFLSKIEDKDELTAIYVSAKDLTTTSPWMYLLIPIERVAAFAVQMCLSVWVWVSVREKKIKLLFTAMGLHFASYFIPSAFNMGLELHAVVVEFTAVAIAVIIVFLTYKFFFKAKKVDNEANIID